MKTLRLAFLSAFFAFSTIFSFAQDIVAVDDTLCIMDGQAFTYNVGSNDILPGGFFSPFLLIDSSDCFGLGVQGNLFLLPGAHDCCGTHTLRYRLENCQPPNKCTARIYITVKCPKPDCFLVDLGDVSQPGNTVDGPAGTGCLAACENARSTYFVAYNPADSYAWSVTGGTFTTGSNPAEINVNWGAQGSGAITLTITNANNQQTTRQFCVEILEAPVAAFTVSDSTICCDGSVSFFNQSTGGNSYFWDFGDGGSSSLFDPTHQYTQPGIYTACLYVTRDNYDAEGNALCCCTDTVCVDIVVDSLKGPKIYCVSTLCAGDSTKYWTDASGCGVYQWTVADENGLPLTFTGQGNDTICVVWGAGPFGAVSLQVSNCDSAYCDEPTTIVVPIVPATVLIGGATSVCENATATYSVPKWLSTYYDWQVSGGTVVSGQGTNTVVVQWGAAPGPGIITLNYYSDFLGGLPGHDPEDCAGNATLSVAIKPVFSVFGLSGPVCRANPAFFSATSFPWGVHDWTITPAAPFTGDFSSFITVNWPAAGTYTVSAVPTNSNIYCNNQDAIVVSVVDPLPADTILGPVKICPGETYTYFAQTSQTGVAYNWTVSGGTPASGNGNPITVTWNTSGTYSISVQLVQLGAPACVSTPVSLAVMAKTLDGPIVVAGPPACINTTQSYTAGPVQHPDATFTWTITPAHLGSIVGGQGTPNVQVQWNNAAGTANLSVMVELCNDMLTGTLSVPVNAPIPPVITQTGNLCPGMTATLSASGSGPFTWTPGGATTPSITISVPGTYSVATTDVNGCPATGTFQAVNASIPTAVLSPPGPIQFCIDPPNNNSVTISISTGTGNSYSWSLNNTNMGLPSTQTAYTHVNTNVVGVFNYQVTVTNTIGCTAVSNVVTVIQTDMCEDPPCNPQPGAVSFTAVNQTPNCNVVNFSATTTGTATLTGWNFGDPNGNANTGTLANAVHTYSAVGCYPVILSGQVPEAPPGTGFCPVAYLDTVCVPLAANFSFVVNCKTVSFTDLSGSLNNLTLIYNWDFGDLNTSNSQHPTHTYATAGTYTVTLTVRDPNGCQAVFTQTVIVAAGPAPLISITPSPLPRCVGTPLTFTGSGAGITGWLWHFGDGASNGSQTAQHAYLNPGPYTVWLVGTDANGCQDSSSQTINIFAPPAPGTINFLPSLQVCAGNVVQLTAPSGTGYSWLWSDNSTGPNLSVTQSGTYSVVITDANGCTAKPDSVTVVILPLPPAFISGNPVICDTGCAVLSAPLGQGYQYQWLDNTNTPLTPPDVDSIHLACAGNLEAGYAVVVTDPFTGCSATSAVTVVTVATSPSFTVSIAPDPCEGKPVTLSVVSPQPNVVYAWTNGDTGISTTVIQAGTYTAVGTDTTSGCSFSASATIHPLPDLCLVPAGCYKVCDPDTICGPAGLAAYQWNLNGVPIANANGPCLIVTQSGTFTLTGTTDQGCTATSDSLMLMVIDCSCDNLTVSASPTGDSCCWTLSYDNPFGNLAGLTIYTNDAEFLFDLSSLPPALTPPNSIGLSTISLANNQFGQPLPQGQLTDFLEFCLTNVNKRPQKVIFDWYDDEFEIFCTDTLLFDCPVEPDCLYLTRDSIYCDSSGQVAYTFTVCNPIDADYSIAYFILQPKSPPGIVLTPNAFDETLNPILPGQCRDYTITLSGPNIQGDTFCFAITAHDEVPGKIDTSLCCMLDTMYCVPVPDCEPCDDVGVEFVDGVSSETNGACCYFIGLYNNFAANYFDGIDLCLLSPATTMTLINPFGSGWQTASYSPTVISLNAIPPQGTTLPLGVIQLPMICIQTNTAPPQWLEIKWMRGDSIVCFDTVGLQCEPPCGYVLNDTVLCNPDGTWTFAGDIKNTSNFTMGEAHVVFTSPAGLGGFNQIIPFPGGLAPGSTWPFSLVIGPPAQGGDSVCFTVALHELNDDSLHINCCNFYDCIRLPDCSAPCVCDQAFIAAVMQGFSANQQPSPSTAVVFTPLGLLSDCDRVIWSWGTSLTALDTTYGNASISHVFPATGNFNVCMIVTRVDPNGTVCSREICKMVNVLPLGASTTVIIFPVPLLGGNGFVEFQPPASHPVSLQIFDLDGRRLIRRDVPLPASREPVAIPATGLPQGVYILEIRCGDEVWVKKIVVM